VSGPRRTFQALILLLGLGALALSGCANRSTAGGKSGRLESCYVKFGDAPRPDASWFDDKAQYDYIVLSPNAWPQPSLRGAADSLRARHRDIRIGCYFHVMAIGQWIFRRVDAGAAPGSWAYEYYHAVTPYLARTNQLDPATGEPDTAAIFENNYCVNILFPEARAAVIDVYTRPEFLGPVDWFFLDFFSVPLPDLKRHQNPVYRQLEHGDLDLDRDGVGHWDDPDEQSALRDAFVAYVHEMRAAVPSRPGGFGLIPNGDLAYTDNELAALVDGVYVEGFPMWSFGSSGVDFAGALDPARVPSLWSLTQPRYRDGSGVVMIEDRFGSGQLGHVAALFDGCVEVQRQRSGDLVCDATRSLRWLGDPTGPAVYAAGGVRREFTHGVVSVEILSASQIEIGVERRP
jgi:hypothetical protein